MDKVFIALRKVRDEQLWEPTLHDKNVALSTESSECDNEPDRALEPPSTTSEVGPRSVRTSPATPSTVRDRSVKAVPTPRPKKRFWSRDSAPQGTGQVDERLVVWHKPTASAAEQYRKLYAEILRVGLTRTLRMILFSSTLAGEGKTTSALNLAAIMGASLGKQGVLIVDTDLRKPSVHTYLGAHPTCGLADYLRGDVEYAQIFAKTPIPSLTAVYAGNKTENPFELLTSEKMIQFIEQIKADSTYRYIILDASPVILTSEPRTLVQHVDTTLLVVRAKKTPKDLIAQAIEALEGADILGLVFNGVSSTDFQYYGDAYETGYYEAEPAQQK